MKKASAACEGLVKWVKAMDVYDRVAKVVAPKKIKLAEAESELSAQMEKLNHKRKELQEVGPSLNGVAMDTQHIALYCLIHPVIPPILSD